MIQWKMDQGSERTVNIVDNIGWCHCGCDLRLVGRVNVPMTNNYCCYSSYFS